MLLDLDEEISEIVQSRIPSKWRKVSYLSSLNLQSFIRDLVERFKFLEVRIRNIPTGIKIIIYFYFKDQLQSSRKGKPIWISGFYRIRSYLMGLIQEYSREKKVPIENCRLIISFDKVVEEELNYSGLYVDMWNKESKKIEESSDSGYLTKEQSLQTFKLIVVSNQTDPPKESDYLCPLYVTPERKGNLEKIGRNPNLITMLEIEIDSQISASLLVKRGVAMTSQKTYDSI